MNLMKKITAAMLAAVMAAGLSACNAGGTASSQPASSEAQGSFAVSAEQKPLEKVSFVLDYTPNTNHTGIYVAQQLGYFKDEGLEVDIQQPPEDGAVGLVGSGKAQFGIGFQDTDLAPALSSDSPIPVTAVAALIQHNTSGIVSEKSKNITRPKEMEGHTYATWDSPVEKAMVNYIIQKDGGDPAKLKMVPAGNDTVAAIRTNVDTGWIYYAWDGIAAQVQGVQTNYFAFKDIDSVFDYYTPVLIANNDFLKNNPETAKKFLKAVQKGYRYAIDHPDDAAKLLIQAVPDLKSSEELVTKSQKWLAGQYQAEVAQWGYIEPKRWNAFYQWLYDNKLIGKNIADNTGFTNEYLPK